MVTKAHSLGPFTGGMNNAAGQASILDRELYLIENGFVDTDGTIKSRPAIVYEETVSPHTGTLTALGYYVRNDGEVFLVVATAVDTQVYQLSTKTWTSIWSTPAASFTQYDDKIVMCSTTVAGGYWEAGTFTAIPTMPLAVQIVFYQERFWLFGVKGTANATTLWFSDLNVISPPSSIYNFDTVNNFITVSRGDGQWITGLLADTNALIIFRSGSTYQFSYPSAPASGTLRVLSKTIGAENQWAFVAYESYFLVLSQGFLYQFINYRFYPLNTKKITFATLALPMGQLIDMRVSIFGSKVLVWYFGSTYVYNLVTASWAMWPSPASNVAHYFTIPPTSTSGAARTALAVTGENDPAKMRLWRMSDTPLATGGLTETYTMRVVTKIYDFAEPAAFKRLFWWAAEVFSATGIDALTHPVIISAGGVTWDQMATTTWDVLALGSWDDPLIIPPLYDDNTTFPVDFPIEETIRVIAATPFVRIFFEVKINLDGTATTTPARLINIVPYLANKENVSQKVS